MLAIKSKPAFKTKSICDAVDAFTIDIKMVSHSSFESVWDHLVSKYHYLGYKKLLGHRLKYIAFIKNQPVAALSFSAPALKLKSRDAHIGWSDVQRKEFLSCLACNSRFLIVPWIKIKNLASHVLSRSVRCLKKDWEKHFGKQLLLIETFVDPEKFKGTIYKAANWTYVGQTYGSAKKGLGYIYHGKPKKIYLYALESKFRDIIGCRQKPLNFFHRPAQSLFKLEELKIILSRSQYHPGLVSDLGIAQADRLNLSDELIKFHEQFVDCYGRIEHRRLAMTYLSGLISNAQAKSVEPIALEFIGKKSVRSLQRFLKNCKWNHEKMLTTHQRLLSDQINEPGGMIHLDSSEFVKKGKESVGVARQYCGVRGKIENCQSGVFVGYSSSKGYGLLNSRLYMPEDWFDEKNKGRRRRNWVPEELNFQTKLEVALGLLNQVKNSSFYQAKWIGCDATFGSDNSFLDALPEDLYYFAEIRSVSQVFTWKSKIGIGEYKGCGHHSQKAKRLQGQPKPRTVSQIAQSFKLNWVPVVSAEGTRGPITSEVARIRIYLSRDELPVGKEKWLFMQKKTDGYIQYTLSNAPRRIKFSELVKASTLRRPIQQFFQNDKSYLGMGNYEHRSWPAWHRHMIFVFLGLHFLLRMRRRYKKNSSVYINDNLSLAGLGHAASITNS
jgi:SRSO17 transposase